jgi:hypothetical protein
MKTLSVHEINSAEHLSFSAKEYSLFKFGSKSMANKFGKELFHTVAANLLITYGAFLRDKMPQLVVCSAPYNHIPTATGAMKDYFVKYLNEWLIDNDCQVVQQTKVHRDTTYREDYGSLSKEQRMELIGRDIFHIDAEFLRHKHILFLDDIRITGSHEEMMHNMLIKAKISMSQYTFQFAYFAQLINPDIHPNIENELNFASIKSIDDILDLMGNEDFVYNTRVVKYLLNSKAKHFREVFELFGRDGETLQLHDTLYHLALGNSYHLVPEYQENLNFLKSILDAYIGEPN